MVWARRIAHERHQMPVFSTALSIYTTAPDSEIYDVNFCLDVPEFLESPRVVLRPFVFGPYNTLEDFEQDLLESRLRKVPAWLLFAVFDKTKPAAGCIIIFPPFQRTHVASNAIGLLLGYALNTSDVQEGALGLRRVARQANYRNKASVGAAERMGYKREALTKWERVLPPRKELVGAGNRVTLRADDPKPDHPGRITVILGFSWEDWENGEREKIQERSSRLGLVWSYFTSNMRLRFLSNNSEKPTTGLVLESTQLSVGTVAIINCASGSFPYEKFEILKIGYCQT
ncbi:hypothetical protein BJ165DRAFT_1596791 [Panaeolus papilionaceus]|nr:hypothetical protein BJ165DRAFT_1596791 [Panaeolus papilionaceus]